MLSIGFLKELVVTHRMRLDPGRVVHTCNPRSGEVKAGRL